MKLQFALSIVLSATVYAQQSAYGQCGGTGWTGTTSCVSGYYCYEQNEYYSQCIPSTSSSATSARPTTSTSTIPIPSTTLRTTTAPTATGTSSFSKAVGTKFEIDGETGYFAGTNAYWIGFLTNNADVDTVMGHLQSSGLKILRVWGFNIATSTPSSGTVWYQSLVPGQAAAINTGANGLERLDYVVQSAAAHDIKLIINFNNNWSDYGGVPAYMTYYGITQEEWYTNSEAQATYQSYIKAVMSRYSSSSAIFAWELMNEPRCESCDTSVIYNWATKTSQYIKSLDPSHMVTLGDEGFNPSAGDSTYPYSTGDGVSFSQNIKISTLDFGTFHCYPGSWSVNDTTWVTEWIQTHAAVCVAANKPCFLEEYGYNADPTILQPWQETAGNTTGIAGDAFWQDGDTLSTGQTSNDGNTIYYGTSAWTTLVTNHVAAIAKKNGFS